jgi:two-component system, LytTR family, response regulator
MIRTVLIDDEPLARSILLEYLSYYPEITIVKECNDGFEGLKAIQEHHPDLIFLDVQMPKINGFEMLELLEQPPAVIFTTAFDEYALKAFEAQAVDYLLKPFSKERLDKTIQKYKEQAAGKRNSFESLANVIRQPEERNRIVVKEAGTIRIIPVQEVHYLEAYDDYVKIHTQKEVFLKKKTMSFYEKALDANRFVRVHRSFILNLGELTKIESFEKETYLALLKSGAKVPLSKSGYATLKSALGI